MHLYLMNLFISVTTVIKDIFREDTKSRLGDYHEFNSLWIFRSLDCLSINW